MLMLNQVFWEFVDENKMKIVIKKENVQRLPQFKEIPMAVIVQYNLNGIEYIAKHDFGFSIIEPSAETKITIDH